MLASTQEQVRDQDLIEQYLQGDASAFESLYHRHRKGISLLVRQYFPNREKAEEVFQEVFTKLLDRLDRYQAQGSFRAWAYTLCRNHCIDRLRYQARRPEVPESAMGNPETGDMGPLSREISRETPSDTAAYDRELAGHLREALDKLSEEQRETFLLKERGGLTFEEISESMGVSINTVKSRMRYALAHLRRALKNKVFVKEALE